MPWALPLPLMPSAGQDGEQGGGEGRRLIQRLVVGSRPARPQICRIPKWERPQNREEDLVPVPLWVGNHFVHFTDGKTEAQRHLVIGKDSGGRSDLAQDTYQVQNG